MNVKFDLLRKMGKRLPFALICFSLICCNQVGLSQNERRVPIPQNFSEEDISQLIEQIGEMKNVSQLKIYFLRRKPTDFPPEEAREKLVSSFEKAAKYSRNWYALGSVLAFSEFFGLGGDVGVGYSSYNSIFDSAKSATDAKSSYLLLQAVNDYMHGVTGKIKDLGLQRDARTAQTTLKAANAFVDLSQSKFYNSALGNQVPLGEALKATNSYSDFIQAFGDTPPNSYPLLIAVAGAFEKDKPEKAVDLLKRAKKILPTKTATSKDINREEANQLFDRLVFILSSLKRFDEAAVEQRERIDLTSNGWGDLWVLLHQAGKGTDAKAIVENLKADKINPHEAIESVRTMTHTKLDVAALKEAHDAAEVVLSALLGRPEKLAVEDEIDARISLGSLHLNDKVYDKAQSAVSMTQPEKMSARAMRSWRALERLRKAISAAVAQTAAPAVAG